MSNPFTPIRTLLTGGSPRTPRTGASDSDDDEPSRSGYTPLLGGGSDDNDPQAGGDSTSGGTNDPTNDPPVASTQSSGGVEESKQDVLGEGLPIGPVTPQQRILIDERRLLRYICESVLTIGNPETDTNDVIQVMRQSSITNVYHLLMLSPEMF